MDEHLGEDEEPMDLLGGGMDDGNNDQEEDLFWLPAKSRQAEIKSIMATFLSVFGYVSYGVNFFIIQMDTRYVI